jgi:DNA polymerase/3'-5' exonuclease PolX
MTAEACPERSLSESRVIAQELVGLLAPYSERMKIVGSIRRQRPTVHDADIVIQGKLRRQVPLFEQTDGTPLELPAVDRAQAAVGSMILKGSLKPRPKKDGTTMVGDRVAFVSYRGLPVDIYFASPETWGGLILIRTGSVEHNLFMVGLAKSRGWILHASGEGLFDSREGGHRLDDGTEESVFRLLGLSYREPELREHRPSGRSDEGSS